MSGHSKWHKIQHAKASTDAKRGKIFTKHAKLIAIAARNGSDPSMNPGLRVAIDNARSDNMPMSNIDRAIKKGSGEFKSGENFVEVLYEGFGHGGTAILIKALTDNRNRTITNLKIIMGKKGGTMGASGSVNYLFNLNGVIGIKKKDGVDVEEVELAAIDAGASDVVVDDDVVYVYTEANLLMQVRNNLEEAGFKPDSAKLVYIPQNEVRIEDEDTRKKFFNLIEALEDDDDVVDVFTNYEE